MVHFNVPDGIKNVALKAAEKFWGVADNWKE